MNRYERNWLCPNILLNVETVDHYNVAIILESQEDEVLVKQPLHRMVKTQVGFKVDFQPKSVLKGIFGL